MTGRPTKYTPEIIQQAKDYLENFNSEHGHMIPSIIGMAKVLNVGKSTLYDWSREKGNEFSDILDKCNDYQQFALLEGGLSGELNSNIVKLALGKHGFSEKVVQDVNVNDYRQLSEDEIERQILEKQHLFEESRTLN